MGIDENRSIPHIAKNYQIRSEIISMIDSVGALSRLELSPHSINILYDFHIIVMYLILFIICDVIVNVIVILYSI